MKNTLFLSFYLIALVLIFSVTSIVAQEETPQPNQNINKPQRPIRILEELGLTREQVQQIRRINAQRKPLMQEAQIRFREANRDLDAAIYAENASEQEIQTRMKEVQLAQAEITKIKTMTEYMIRKVLTTEQLEKFRQLRERLMQRQNNQNNQQNRPGDRLQQRRNQ